MGERLKVAAVVACLVPMGAVGCSSDGSTEGALTQSPASSVSSRAGDGSLEVRPVLEVTSKPGKRCPARSGADGSEPTSACASDGSLYSMGPAFVTARDVVGAEVVPDPSGTNRWGVNITLSPTGTQALLTVTSDAVGSSEPENLIAIVSDGTVLAVPMVLSPIDDGVFMVGLDSKSEAEALADLLT